MPSHSHNYQKFRYDQAFLCASNRISFYYFPSSLKEYDYLENSSTTSEGRGKAHNNMPPYITANCWMRVS